MHLVASSVLHEVLVLSSTCTNTPVIFQGPGIRSGLHQSSEQAEVDSKGVEHPAQQGEMWKALEGTITQIQTEHCSINIKLILMST